MTEAPKVPTEPEGIVLSAAEKERRNRRSRAIGLAVAGLVVLFYLITVFKMGPAIMSRSL
ncbi:hypothetical protein MCEMSEM23_00154 [Rhabdaerophilaceae bacterium]